MQFASNRELDIIFIGRAGIDFNAGQFNRSFADVEYYTKSVGGSPANMAQAAAKLGLSVGFIGKISNDHMGDFIINQFQAQGISTEGIVRDQTGARNCLAITEVLSPSQSGSFMYRENTADLLIQSNEINPSYIAQSKAILISGTALSSSPSREAIFKAVEYAQKNDVRICLDIDYRPFGWKNKEETSDVLTEIAQASDIIIGNREEFDVLEGQLLHATSNNFKSAAFWLSKGVSFVVIKNGEKGSQTFSGDQSLIDCGVIPTQIKKTYGSGDSFAGGFLYGLLRNWSTEQSIELGTACASLCLTGMSCVDTLPTLSEAMEHLSKHNVTAIKNQFDL